MLKVTDPFDTRSPYERLEITRRKRLNLAIINGTVLVLIPFVGYVAATFIPEGSTAAYIVSGLSIGTIPMVLVARWFVSRDRLSIGSFVYLFYFILLMTVNTIILEGLMPIVAPALILMNIIGGMMLTPVQKTVFAIISIPVFIILRLRTLDDEFLLQMQLWVSLGLEFLIIGITFVFAVFINKH